MCFLTDLRGVYRLELLAPGDTLNDLYKVEAEGMLDEDNIRFCSHCGLPMFQGYYLGGEYARSDACALVLYKGDEAQMKEDLSHADEEDGECYWTEWESIYCE